MDSQEQSFTIARLEGACIHLVRANGFSDRWRLLYFGGDQLFLD
jgi:hypothetical protein